MKNLIMRLPKVADSTGYSLLRSESRSSTKMPAVPAGHLPMFVGEEMERFVVSAKLLNHPIFVQLLEKSAELYGYEQNGVLRIPCPVFLFERLLEAVRLGEHCSGDLLDLLNSLSD